MSPPESGYKLLSHVFIRRTLFSRSETYVTGRYYDPPVLALMPHPEPAKRKNRKDPSCQGSCALYSPPALHTPVTSLAPPQGKRSLVRQELWWTMPYFPGEC